MATILICLVFFLRLFALGKAAALLRKNQSWQLTLLTVLIACTLIPITKDMLDPLYWSQESISELLIQLLYSAVVLFAAYYAAFSNKAIGKRKERLRDLSQAFDQFTRKAPVACFIVQDERFVFSNHAFHHLTRLTEEDLSDTPYWQIADSEYADQMKSLGGIFDDEMTSVDTKIRLIDKNGLPKWVQITVGGVLYKQRPAVAGTMLDITDELMYQQELQRKEEQLRTAADAAGLMVWEYSLTEPHLTVIESEAIRDRLNKHTSFDAETLIQVIHPDDRERLTTIIRDSYSQADRFAMEFRMREKNGHYAWWSLEGKAYLDKDKNPIRVSGTTRRIHEDKIVKETIRENEERLRLATEIAGIQVWEWSINSDGISHHGEASVNNCLDVTQYSEFVSRIHPDHKSRVLSAIQDAIEHGKRYEEEFQIKGDDGNYYWQHAIGQLFHEAGSGEPVRMLGAAIDTTERKRIESLTAFQADLLEKIGESVIAQNREGQLTYLNKAARLLVGDVRNEDLPMDIDGIIPQDQRVINTPEIIGQLKEGNTWSGEHEASRMNGEIVPVHLSVSPIMTETGEYDGFVSISRDLTDYNRIQRQLRKSEERLRLALDAGNILVWDVDLATQSVERIIPKTIPQKNSDFDSLEGMLGGVHPDDVAETKIKFDECVQFKRPFSIEHRFISPEGTYNWWYTQGRFYQNEENPKAVRIIGTAQEISQRKITEALVQQQLQQLQAMLRAIPDNVIHIDSNGTLLEIKTVGEFKLLLHAFPEVDSSIYDVLPDDFAALLRTKVATCLEENKPHDFEYAGAFDDTTCNFEIRLAPSGHNRVLIVVRDITEQLRLQQTILDISSWEQRRIGQDLHDELGQLLTGIGFSVAALKQDALDVNGHVAENAGIIGKLVEKAITQTRLLAEGLNPISLDYDGLQTGLERLTLQTQELYGIPCTFACNGDDHPLGEEIANQVYRIGQEAVNNAVKHGKPTKIDVHLSNKNGATRLVVRDDGVGFPPLSQRSQGLGLRIMEYRARVIGAQLEIESTGQQGTTVSCTFSGMTNMDKPG